MIARIWRGWTAPDKADAYETALRETIIPSIEARGISGLLSIDILRRVDGNADLDEVEFSTIFWFASESDIVGFVGDDMTIANIPDIARKLLSRWDERAVHYTVQDQRSQR
ncbi:hypothetical protein ACR9YC_08905 [Parasphingorhabdus sp. DH2-15]|uniref:hypothetical protein n=1 Tax=Parasphingorhabdus sp. DH2-15 TaxID=3444112 RepID=UPI003F687166